MTFFFFLSLTVCFLSHRCAAEFRPLSEEHHCRCSLARLALFPSPPPSETCSKAQRKSERSETIQTTINILRLGDLVVKSDKCERVEPYSYRPFKERSVHFFFCTAQKRNGKRTVGRPGDRKRFLIGFHFKCFIFQPAVLVRRFNKTLSR